MKHIHCHKPHVSTRYYRMLLFGKINVGGCFRIVVGGLSKGSIDSPASYNWLDRCKARFNCSFWNIEIEILNWNYFSRVVRLIAYHRDVNISLCFLSVWTIFINSSWSCPPLCLHSNTFLLQSSWINFIYFVVKCIWAQSSGTSVSCWTSTQTCQMSDAAAFSWLFPSFFPTRSCLYRTRALC